MNYAPIIYFFAGSAKPTAEYAARFEDENGNARGCFAADAEGPAGKGKRGCMAATLPRCLLQYKPDRQRWDEVADGVFIGADKFAKPEMFLRENSRIGGRGVAMADGNQWVMPVANPFVQSLQLPVWHRRNKKKLWENVVRDEFRELSDRAMDLCQQLIGQVRESRNAGGENGVVMEFRLDDEVLRGLIADALALNYDVTLEELSALRVFAPDVYWPAIETLLDWPEVLNVLDAELDAAERSEGSAAVPFADAGNTGSL